jgi:hypothetical protein
MPIGFQTCAWRVFAVGAFAITVAGCASLRSTPPPPALPPLDTTDSGFVRTHLTLADLREDGADWVGAQAVDKALAQQPASHALPLRGAALLLQRPRTRTRTPRGRATSRASPTRATRKRAARHGSTTTAVATTRCRGARRSRRRSGVAAGSGSSRTCSATAIIVARGA